MNSDISCACDFDVAGVVDDKLFIIDLDLGNRSVTNDAENVARWAQENYRGKRLIYRDSMGRWDEIVINMHNAVTFVPFTEDVPQVCLLRVYEEA
jgi:hypothetical protein